MLTALFAVALGHAPRAQSKAPALSDGRPAESKGPAFVDITWMSISNMYYELGTFGIVTDGYLTRIPQCEFFGGGGGLAHTTHAFVSDMASVQKVLTALGGPSRVRLKAEGLTSVNLWIGSANAAAARVLMPILSPKAYLPVHWDGLYGAFEAGAPRPYADAPLESALAEAKVLLLRPVQYMDKCRLDREEVRPIPNDKVKHALGFSGDRSAGRQP